MILYNMDEKTQINIPGMFQSGNSLGVEGSEGITSITVSPSRKYVAVCEKAERALCMVWDISGVSANPVVQPKRKKILTSTDYLAKEFISVAFAPTNEKSLLATLVSYTFQTKYCRQENQTGRSFFGCGTSRSALPINKWELLATCWSISAPSTTKITT